MLHCIFIEAIWIRSYFFNDETLANKLKSLADANVVNINQRHSGLPEFKELKKYAESCFNENIILLKKLSAKSIKKKYSVSYILNFLHQHHSQHIETMQIIINLHNIKFNKNFHNFVKEIAPKQYKFSGVEIKKGTYKVGAKKIGFSLDNENPRHGTFLNNYIISKKLISISEWLAFIKEDGYNRKNFWSEEGWSWRTRNTISFPMNWIFKNKYSFSISTPDGYITPKQNIPVSNISKFEIDAFAKWANLRVPHEFEWEVSANFLCDKFKVWEWSANKFFGYKCFKPYPYIEYSYPWFNNNYYTLKGSSVVTLKDVKRVSFRNFYKPDSRYIFSGGRLCI